MKAILFLLLSFLIPIIQSCLVVRSISPAPPTCNCSYVALNRSNIASYVSDSSFYSNVSKYEIETPIVTSLDCCLVSMHCEGDYSIVVFYTDSETNFGNRPVYGICNRYNQTWDIYDEKDSIVKGYDRFYATCVNFKSPPCNCSSMVLDRSNIASHVSDSSFYLNVSTYPIKAPNLWLNGCSLAAQCEGNYSLVAFDTKAVTNFGINVVDGECDRYTQTWLVDDKSGSSFTIYQRMYVTCVDFNSPPCNCSSKVLDSSNIATYVSDSSFYSNVSTYPIMAPNVSITDCSVSAHCDGNYSLMVFDINSVTNFGTQRISGLCHRYDQTWGVQDNKDPMVWLLHRFYATCVDFNSPKCNCSYMTMDSSNIATYVSDSSFYSNISSYPLKTPIASIKNCTGSFYCEDDYSLVVFDTNSVTNFGEYAADGLCDPYTQTWLVDDGTGFSPYQRIYATCVDFKSPAKCNCSSMALDKSNIATYVSDSPFYSNLSTYPLKSPIFTLSDCSVSVKCEGSTSLIVFDTDTVTNFGNRTVSGFCDKHSQTWGVQDGSGSGLITFKRLYATCVDFKKADDPTICNCSYTTLDNSNLATYVSDSSFYSNFSTYLVQIPIATISDCFVSMYCDVNNSLVVFDKDSVINFGTYSILGLCDRQTRTWGIQDGRDSSSKTLNRLYATCVDFSSPVKCNCSSMALDSSNIATYVSDSPFYSNVTSYPLKAPIFTLSDCSVSVKCEGNTSLIVFDADTVTNFGNRTVSGFCDKHSQTWGVQDGGGSGLLTFKRLYATCVDFKKADDPTICNCSYTTLDSSNIATYVSDSPFYSNVSTYLVQIPIATISDCFVSMYCDVNNSLVVFDKNSVINFGTYSILGLCDRQTRTWRIQDGRDSSSKILNRLYAACVDFNSQTKCNCSSMALDSSNIATYVSDSPFYSNVSTYPTKAPIFTLSDCSVSVKCEGNTSLIVFDTDTVTNFGNRTISGFCDKHSQTWGVQDGSGSGLLTFKRLYATCVDFKKTDPTSCNCPYMALNRSNLATYVTDELLYSNVAKYPITAPIFTISNCSSVSVYCEKNLLVVLDKDEFMNEMPSSIVGFCDQSSQKWSVKNGNDPVRVFNRLYVTCVDFSGPLQCNCPYMALNSSNIATHVSNSSLYSNLLTYPMKNPIFSVDNCTGQVNCGDKSEYTLVLFEKDSVKNIGPSSYIQCWLGQTTWVVSTQGESSHFQRVFATCVNFKKDQCTPNSPRTFLFAHSYDADYQVLKSAHDFIKNSTLHPLFFTVAAIRFDTKKEDEFRYSAEFRDKGMLDMIRFFYNEPHDGFDNPDTGSDVLRVIEKFVSSSTFPVCGGTVLIMLKRYPNKEDISSIVAKLRENRVTIQVMVSANPSGGKDQKLLYDIATQTHGLCAFIDDLKGPPKDWPISTDPYLLYSANIPVSGSNMLILPPMTAVNGDGGYNYFLTIQDHAPLDSFQIIQLVCYNEETYPMETMVQMQRSIDYNEDGNSTYIVARRSVKPAVYNVTVGYKYASDAAQILQFRVTSHAAVENWIPYDN